MGVQVHGGAVAAGSASAVREAAGAALCARSCGLRLKIVDFRGLRWQRATQ